MFAKYKVFSPLCWHNCYTRFFATGALLPDIFLPLSALPNDCTTFLGWTKMMAFPTALPVGQIPDREFSGLFGSTWPFWANVQVLLSKNCWWLHNVAFQPCFPHYHTILSLWMPPSIPSSITMAVASPTCLHVTFNLHFWRFQSASALLWYKGMHIIDTSHAWTPAIMTARKNWPSSVLPIGLPSVLSLTCIAN